MTSPDTTVGLSELWLLPSGIAPFALIQSANDTDVVVPCGWRGPYLRLALGQTSIRDGWGNPLNLPQLRRAPGGRGQPIAVVSAAVAAPAVPTTRP